jgi:hypothetical protein
MEQLHAFLCRKMRLHMQRKERMDRLVAQIAGSACHIPAGGFFIAHSRYAAGNAGFDSTSHSLACNFEVMYSVPPL